MLAKMKINVEAEEVPESKAATPVKQQIIWPNVVLLIVTHLTSLYAAAVVVPRLRLITLAWLVIYWYSSGFGVTAGVHRYWTHKTFKAKLPLRILLAVLYLVTGLICTNASEKHTASIFQDIYALKMETAVSLETMAQSTNVLGVTSQDIRTVKTVSKEYSIFHWVRDHRVHHKFSETDADPHNASRGLFYSHVGWLMLKKHPDVLRHEKQVYMSDVLADPVVQFQEKYFTQLRIIFAFLIPICVPCLLWDETWSNSIFSNILRWMFGLNCFWSINSFAHIYGLHPYNRHISPAENRVVSALSSGEGWHNYHHMFPWDYKTAELGDYGLNLTTAFIDFFAYIGWAYDLKQPSEELVQRVVQQLGDGSHTKWGHVKEVPEEGEQLKDNIEEMLLKAEEKAKGI